MSYHVHWCRSISNYMIYSLSYKLGLSSKHLSTESSRHSSEVEYISMQHIFFVHKLSIHLPCIIVHCIQERYGLLKVAFRSHWKEHLHCNLCLFWATAVFFACLPCAVIFWQVIKDLKDSEVVLVRNRNGFHAKSWLWEDVGVWSWRVI